MAMVALYAHVPDEIKRPPWPQAFTLQNAP